MKPEYESPFKRCYELMDENTISREKLCIFVNEDRLSDSLNHLYRNLFRMLGTLWETDSTACNNDYFYQNKEEIQKVIQETSNTGKLPLTTGNTYKSRKNELMNTLVRGAVLALQVPFSSLPLRAECTGKVWSLHLTAAMAHQGTVSFSNGASIPLTLNVEKIGSKMQDCLLIIVEKIVYFII